MPPLRGVIPRLSFDTMAFTRPPLATPEPEDRVLDTPELARYAQFFANDQEIEEALNEPLATIVFDLPGNINPKSCSTTRNDPKPSREPPSSHSITSYYRRLPRVARVPSSDSGEESVVPTPAKPFITFASSPPIATSTSSHDSGIDLSSSPSLEAKLRSASKTLVTSTVCADSGATHNKACDNIIEPYDTDKAVTGDQGTPQPKSNIIEGFNNDEATRIERMLAAATLLVPELERSHLIAAVNQVHRWSSERADLQILVTTILGNVANDEETSLFQTFVRDAETYLRVQGKLEDAVAAGLPFHSTEPALPVTKNGHRVRVKKEPGDDPSDLPISTCDTDGTTTSNMMKGTPDPNISQAEHLQRQVNKNIRQVLSRGQPEKALAIWQIHEDALRNPKIRDLLTKCLDHCASADELNKFRALLRVTKAKVKALGNTKHETRTTSKSTQTMFTGPLHATSRRKMLSAPTQTNEILTARLQESDRRSVKLESVDPMIQDHSQDTTNASTTMLRLATSQVNDPAPVQNLAAFKQEIKQEEALLVDHPFRTLRDKQTREDAARQAAKYLMQNEDGRDSELYLHFRREAAKSRNAAIVATERLCAALSDDPSEELKLSVPHTSPIAILVDLIGDIAGVDEGYEMDVVKPEPEFNNDTLIESRAAVAHHPHKTLWLNATFGHIPPTTPPRDITTTYRAPLAPAASPPPSPPGPSPSPPPFVHCPICDYHVYGSGNHSRYCEGFRALRKANKKARRLEERLRKEATGRLRVELREGRVGTLVVESKEETYRIANGSCREGVAGRGSRGYWSWR